MPDKALSMPLPALCRRSADALAGTEPVPRPRMLGMPACLCLCLCVLARMMRQATIHHPDDNDAPA